MVDLVLEGARGLGRAQEGRLVRPPPRASGTRRCSASQRRIPRVRTRWRPCRGADCDPRRRTPQRCCTRTAPVSQAYRTGRYSQAGSPAAPRGGYHVGGIAVRFGHCLVLIIQGIIPSLERPKSGKRQDAGNATRHATHAVFRAPPRPEGDPRGEDLVRQKVLVNQRGCNSVTDAVTDDLRASVVPVQVEEYEFINVDMFNHCEEEGRDDFARQLIGSNRAGARLIARPSRIPQLNERFFAKNGAMNLNASST